MSEFPTAQQIREAADTMTALDGRYGFVDVGHMQWVASGMRHVAEIAESVEKSAAERDKLIDDLARDLYDVAHREPSGKRKLSHPEWPVVRDELRRCAARLIDEAGWTKSKDETS
jgi:hypothetical protein